MAVSDNGDRVCVYYCSTLDKAARYPFTGLFIAANCNSRSSPGQVHPLPFQLGDLENKHSTHIASGTVNFQVERERESLIRNFP